MLCSRSLSHLGVVRTSIWDNLTQKVKNPPAMWETQVWSLGQEDSPGEGTGYPPQYSMDRGSWWATVPGVPKSWIRLSDFHFSWTIFKVFIAFVTILLLIFMFWGFVSFLFGWKECGISAPWLGIEPTPPALEGEVLTTWPPGTSQGGSWLKLFKMLRTLLWEGLLQDETWAFTKETVFYVSFEGDRVWLQRV